MFREDLYHRLSVIIIDVPPLKNRLEDIPLLVRHFVKKCNAEMGKHGTGVSEGVMKLLVDHDWRGNIRELQNVIERAIIFAEGETLELTDIGFTITSAGVSPEGREDLQSLVKVYEKEQIYRALTAHDWDKAETAKALGIGVSSLYRKMDELEIVNRRERVRKNGQ